MARGLLGALGHDQTRLFLSSMVLSATGKPLDLLYSRLGGLQQPFFAHGWGDLRVVDYEADMAVLSTWPPQELKVWVVVFCCLCVCSARERAASVRTCTRKKT